MTVASGTPNETVNVTVTNNGYGGTGFVGSPGQSPTSSTVQAQITAFIHAPEVTVIAWVNGNAPDLNPLPSGANSTLINDLNSGPTSCAITVGAWALRSRLDVNSSADVNYANAWLMKNSANPQPPPSIVSPQVVFAAGNYRLFNDFGNGKAGYNVGTTPDPCNTGLIPGWLAPGPGEPIHGRLVNVFQR